MTSTLRDITLWTGIIFYAIAAIADAGLTLHGIDNDPTLEANLLLRSFMIKIGPLETLILFKSLVGITCILVAVYLKPEIKRHAEWIKYVPMLPVVRRWLDSGDRSWIAYIPLYATAVAWTLAAFSWSWLLYVSGV